MSGEAVEYVRGIPVVKVFQQTVYSFKAFYAAILSYSDLAGKYAMSCQMGNTCFLSAINGTFLLLIPAALYIASVSVGWGVIPNFIFYALFAPACGDKSIPFNTSPSFTFIHRISLPIPISYFKADI